MWYMDTSSGIAPLAVAATWAWLPEDILGQFFLPQTSSSSSDENLEGLTQKNGMDGWVNGLRVLFLFSKHWAGS